MVEDNLLLFEDIETEAEHLEAKRKHFLKAWEAAMLSEMFSVK